MYYLFFTQFNAIIVFYWLFRSLSPVNLQHHFANPTLVKCFEELKWTPSDYKMLHRVYKIRVYKCWPVWHFALCIDMYICYVHTLTLCGLKLKYYGRTRTVCGLLMAWLLVSPGHHEIDGSMQDCSISSALAMEMLQSCTKPSKYTIDFEG